jgi:hypothetical protein
MNIHLVLDGPVTIVVKSRFHYAKATRGKEIR